MLKKIKCMSFLKINSKTMKRFALMLFLMVTNSALKAQDAWLSTPESIDQFREYVESMKPDTTQFDVEVINKTIALTGRELDIRLYKPKGDDLNPTLIYVHGACWVAGSLDSHDEICRYLAIKSDVNVIAINYRLAPEHKFPAGHNDVYDATNWVWNHAEELGLDSTKFAIAGESTGAYFTVATALKSRHNKNSPNFTFQLLVYAALDGGGSSWTPCKDLYFNDVTEVRSDYGSPLWSEDLSGLPSTYTIFGEYEISRAEEELFIEKLKNQNVQTKSFMNKGVGHDVVKWLSVNAITPAHQKAIEFIKEGFKADK
jgi:acetyl esterase